MAYFHYTVTALLDLAWLNSTLLYSVVLLFHSPYCLLTVGGAKPLHVILYGAKLRSRHSRMRHEHKQTMEELEAMVYLLLGLWFFVTGRQKAEQQKAREEREERQKRLQEARKNAQFGLFFKKMPGVALMTHHWRHSDQSVAGSGCQSVAGSRSTSLVLRLVFAWNLSRAGTKKVPGYVVTCWWKYCLNRVE